MKKIKSASDELIITEMCPQILWPVLNMNGICERILHINIYEFIIHVIKSLKMLPCFLSAVKKYIPVRLVVDV